MINGDRKLFSFDLNEFSHTILGKIGKIFTIDFF
jgi:hypothetical protein